MLDRKGQPARDHPAIRWGTLHARLAYPVTAELYVDRILDREEFRRLCDSCGTRAEILQRLGAGADSAAQPQARAQRASRVSRACSRCGWQPRADSQDVIRPTCPRCGGTVQNLGADTVPGV